MILKNIKMLVFYDYIWNHYKKCIQISTNMPGICSLICEIMREHFRNFREQKYFCSVKPMPAFQELTLTDDRSKVIPKLSKISTF